MRSSPYYCPACDTRIQRKSNALRHLETIHDNRGVLYDRSNNLVDTTAKAAVPFWLDGKHRHDGDDLRGVDGRRPDNDAMPGPQTKTMESNNIDEKSEDDVYYGCVGELGLSLDELDALLSGHFPGVKGKIRGMVLLWAFASPNPGQNSSPSHSWYPDVFQIRFRCDIGSEIPEKFRLSFVRSRPTGPGNEIRFTLLWTTCRPF